MKITKIFRKVEVFICLERARIKKGKKVYWLQFENEFFN